MIDQGENAYYNEIVKSLNGHLLCALDFGYAQIVLNLFVSFRYDCFPIEHSTSANRKTNNKFS